MTMSQLTWVFLSIGINHLSNFSDGTASAECRGFSTSGYRPDLVEFSQQIGQLCPRPDLMKEEHDSDDQPQ